MGLSLGSWVHGHLRMADVGTGQGRHHHLLSHEVREVQLVKVMLFFSIGGRWEMTKPQPPSAFHWERQVTSSCLQYIFCFLCVLCFVLTLDLLG